MARRSTPLTAVPDLPISKRSRVPDLVIADGPRVTTRAEAETAISTMPDQYLDCRSMSHRWVSFAASHDVSDGTYKRTLRCDRCLTERVQLLDRYGAIVSGSYNYPEDYSIKGLGRAVGEARDAFRLASVVRTIDGLSVAGERRGPRSRRARRAS